MGSTGADPGFQKGAFAGIPLTIFLFFYEVWGSPKRVYENAFVMSCTMALYEKITGKY